MAQLTGREVSTIYQPKADGSGLEVAEVASIQAGDVMTLEADAIHHIDNPCSETSAALHLYGGDFGALEPERSLWSTHDHEEIPFSFPMLVKQSVVAMKADANDEGLEALATAIPAVRPMLQA